MIKFSDICVLQIEVSNYCNASCPQCPRNFFGGRVIPTLPLRSWRLVEFKKIFNVQLLDQLTQVYFCGTYGDPLTNTNLIEMCKFLKDGNPKIEIGIHTNGGIGKPEKFQTLATVVDFIAFGIDGLEDTNHIYRRGVKWSKVMENSQSFIQSGGRAIWDFIVFRHNQHQVEQARALSKEMQFADFSIKRTGRFLDRSHNYNDHLVVYNSEDFIDYTIAVPTDANYVNESYHTIKFFQAPQNLRDYARTTQIKCNAVRIKEIYIGADGFVFPCGWLHDRLYGPDVESHSDHLMIKKLIADAGGLKGTNVFHGSLENIVNGDWFDIIEKSWGNSNRLDRCGIMCGEKINLIGKQNTEVTYKS